MEMGQARRRLEALLQAYVDKSRVAEGHRRKEYSSVIKLQWCAWRRRMVYNLLRKWSCAATNIQRAYRGHLGRERFLLTARNRDKALRMAYFNHKATVIQKMFRGYYSRKYVHSYYARKEFLVHAVKKGTEVKNELVNNYKEQCISRYKAAAKKAQEEIDRFMESSHFFLGTESCKGIYYSPYLAVLGKPNQVEDEIRATRRRHNSLQDMKEIRRVKKKPAPELWRSNFITSIGPYFTPVDVRRREEKAAKLWQYADEDFKTTLRDRSNLFKGKTIRIETEYGCGLTEKKAKKDMKEKWHKISESPFFVSVPRGRRFSCGGK